jgi:hypothetical protein
VELAIQATATKNLAGQSGECRGDPRYQADPQHKTFRQIPGRNLPARLPVLDHDAIKWNRIMISSLCLSMISAQTRFRVC